MKHTIGFPATCRTTIPGTKILAWIQVVVESVLALREAVVLQQAEQAWSHSKSVALSGYAL